MELVTFQDERQAAEMADGWCRTKLAATGASSLFIPAGKSVTGLYALWEENRPDYLEGVALVQVDDVADGPRRGMFLDFLYEQLPSYRARIVPVARSVAPAELAVLGFGTNGHVAFHEPDLREDFDKAVVPLADDTLERLGLAPGTSGLTYGVGAFLDAAAVLLIVAGDGKISSFRRFLAGDLALPAARLRAHADLTVLVDEAILDASA